MLKYSEARMARSRRHHYIAQFYLRNFAEPMYGEDLWVYERGSCRWEERTTRGVGWYPHLFTMFDNFGERTDAFERFLTEQVESPAAPALRKAAASPERLTADDREALAMFVGVTVARTPAMLGTTRQSYLNNLPRNEGLELTRLSRLWAQYVSLPQDRDPKDDFTKPSALGAVLVWAVSLRDRMLAWEWHFIRTSRDRPLVTSDWPVYAEKHPTCDVRFIQFPISAEIALVVNDVGELR